MEGILGDTDVKEEHGCDVVGLESLAFKKKVYVCGLPDKTSANELIQFFNKYAPVTRCKLIYKIQTGQFLSIGFIEFKNERAADLVRNIHYFKFKGNQIEVKKAFPSRSAENKNISIAIHEQDSQLRRKKVFVDGIPRDTRASDIVKYFNIYAPVEDFFFDGGVQAGLFQRHGYIIFETEAAANYILKIRFFKFRNTLIEAKTALLGEITKKENSALGLNNQVQRVTQRNTRLSIVTKT
ncbi:unnamed protein product [Hymenolepis diminuta]|uniref:RRM domain-containing protein n=1 Tax=Hymenolepis diminuta TaxID=6216 RepID=A0A564YL52_HYMDI|nr:unnamed protein product [Hymenolepis diminuta]